MCQRLITLFSSIFGFTKLYNLSVIYYYSITTRITDFERVNVRILKIMNVYRLSSTTCMWKAVGYQDI